MKTLLALAAASAVAAFAAPAFAATNGSIGYSQFSISSTDVNAISGRFAWDMTDDASSIVFGIEGEAALGIGEQTKGTGASREASKLSSEFGVFGVATAPLSDNFSVFARAGYANVDIKNTLGTGSTATHASYSEGGLAYGAGATWNWDDMNGMRFDYTHYDTNIASTASFKGYDANAWTLSLVHNFK